MYGTPEYNAWRSMIQRCNNPRTRSWKNYGARGIKVHPGWEENFEGFLADVGPRPSRRHSLDRIDNEGDYEPGNVRWSTPKVQARNKRTSRVLTVRGESATLAEWAERTGIGRSTIRQRLERGWSEERAVTEPASKS
jgi:ribosomal protein S30